MKANRFFGILCVSWAAFALPAAVEAAGQSTPATMGICDDLADATPGLQGLCVAMCEAQSCVAEINAAGELQFSPSCEPSAPQLLENYTKLAKPGDPGMPCVQVACPCWSRAELANIGGLGNDQFIGGKNWGFLWSGVLDRGVYEFASIDLRSCSSASADFPEGRSADLDAKTYDTCWKSFSEEIEARWPSQ